MREYYKKYYPKNREIILLNCKKRYDLSKEKRRKQIYIYQTNRKKIDPNYKLSKNLRRLLNQAINYYAKTRVFLCCQKYPIDFASIITYLFPFPDRKKYQIDHIKPLCSFNLTDPEQVKLAFDPTNLQWITSEQNLKKGKS